MVRRIGARRGTSRIDVHANSDSKAQWRRSAGLARRCPRPHRRDTRDKSLRLAPLEMELRLFTQIPITRPPPDGYATRTASSEKKRSRRGEPLPRHEPKLELPDCERPNSVLVTAPFRNMKALQKFSSVHAQVHNHFNQERHLVTRHIYKQRRTAALAESRALAA